MIGRKILIVLLVLALLVLAYLVYINWGKVKQRIAPAANQGASDMGEIVVAHGGWGIPDGIDGDKLQEDMILSLGSIGDEVRMIQGIVNTLADHTGNSNQDLNVDGVFGPKTLAAVKKYAGVSSITLTQWYNIANNIMWA